MISDCRFRRSRNECELRQHRQMAWHTSLGIRENTPVPISFSIPEPMTKATSRHRAAGLVERRFGRVTGIPCLTASPLNRAIQQASLTCTKSTRPRPTIRVMMQLLSYVRRRMRDLETDHTALSLVAPGKVLSPTRWKGVTRTDSGLINA